MKPSLIYFDNAATTYPKPETVYRAVTDAMRLAGGNPGRSGHRLSLNAAEQVFRTRSAVADFFGSPSPERVVFTYNTTYALNIAIHALLEPGSHVLISNFEHNSVLRPLSALEAKGLCQVDIFDAFGATEEEILQSFRAAVTPHTRLAVICHASNVCGVLLPVEAIGRVCRENGIRLIVDAAQSAGSHPLSLKTCPLDVLCAPAHKGLYGPQGGGFLLFSEDCPDLSACPTLIQGGNGIRSLERTMPDMLPDRLEAGTLGTPVLAGLEAGIRFISERGADAVGQYEERLKRHITRSLLTMDAVTVYAADRPHGGTVLFNIAGKSSEETARELDALGVCVRGGFHCSPLAHARLGTGENGAVRVSLSPMNTVREADEFLFRLRGLLPR